jgi:hypothetical protein
MATTRSGKPARKKSKLSAADQTRYAMDVLNLINVAREIREGRANQLADMIEESLPEYLHEMGDFKNSTVMCAAFYLTRVLFHKVGKPVPKGLAGLMAAYGNAPGGLSKTCHPLIKCKGGILCIKQVSSLQPVDVNKIDNQGFRYVIGSACGWKLPRLKKPCGAPVTGEACTDDLPDFVT